VRRIRLVAAVCKTVELYDSCRFESCRTHHGRAPEMVRRARLLNGASERACEFDSRLFRQEVWPSPVYGARLENERSAMARRFESFHLRQFLEAWLSGLKRSS
jgi:hypothetical protein